MPKPLTIRVAEAAAESDLPTSAKHLILTMALYANSKNATGFHGQGTLARLTGMTERHVRRVLASISTPDAAPVRVERRARFRGDGRGRTSDEWRLVLNQPDTMSGKTDDQPDPVSGETSRLTGHLSTTNRTFETDQPDTMSGDPRCDPRCDPRSTSAPQHDAGSTSKKRAGGKTPKRTSRKPKPQRTDEERAAHAEVVATYFEAVEKKTGKKPASFDARAGASVWKLLDKLGGMADLACERVSNAVLSDWGSTTSIHAIATDPDKYLVRNQKSVGGRHGPPQANSGSFDPRKYERDRSSA